MQQVTEPKKSPDWERGFKHLSCVQRYCSSYIASWGPTAIPLDRIWENVLRKIEAWHQGSIAGYRIMYRDSEGVWDGVEWDGEHATFFTIRETDEAAAEKKLLAHQAN